MIEEIFEYTEPDFDDVYALEVKMNEVIRALNTKELAATDSQQLKAEIASIASDLECIININDETKDRYVKRLRRLSAQDVGCMPDCAHLVGRHCINGGGHCIRRAEDLYLSKHIKNGAES